MSIVVKLPGDFVSLETLLESLTDAVAGKRRLARELPWWGTYENYSDRINELVKRGLLHGRNAMSKERLPVFIADAVFHINDLNSCDALKDGLFDFVVSKELADDERFSLLPALEARRWDEAEPFDEARRTIVRNFSGHVGTTAETLTQFCDEVSDRMERWRKGEYEILEAAQVLADQNANLHAASLCEQMEIAAHTGQLVRRLNGVPIEGRPLPYRTCWNKTVLQADVNDWLTRIKAGYLLEYPYSTANQNPPKPAAKGNGTLIVWTAERKAEARAYRDKHGLKKTAEYYEVSQATISKQIPAGKAKPKPLGPWGGLQK